MDVSKDSIAVAVLAPDRDTAEVDKIFHDTDSVRRLVKRIGRPKGIWACYEAGPTGYDLQRLFASMGVRCDVVAPSLIPKGSGDRVKTDRRDAEKLARLLGQIRRYIKNILVLQSRIFRNEVAILLPERHSEFFVIPQRGQARLDRVALGNRLEEIKRQLVFCFNPFP